MKRLSRRRSLRVLAAPAISAAMLVACGPRATSQIETNTGRSVTLPHLVATTTTSTETAAGSATAAGSPTATVSAAEQASKTVVPPVAGTSASSSSGAGAILPGSTSNGAGASTTGKPSRAAAAGVAATSPVTVYAYFTQGNQLVKEQSEVSATAPLRGSIDALLAGPKDSSHYTQIPKGTRLLDLNLAGPNVLIDLSSQAENIQGSPAIPLFLAQVVSTATQFPAVRQVTLRIAGRPVTSLGGEGMAIPEPLDKSAVQKLLQTP